MRWQQVCQLADLVPDRGASALVDGQQIALFKLAGVEEVYAVSHRDPFSGANVMARGLVGSHGDVATIASPMHKQVFNLRTGECLEDPHVRLKVWNVRIQDGWVQVQVGSEEATG